MRFPPGRKHGNKKIVVDGQKFDSKREYLRWAGLCLEEKGGIITNLRRQVSFVLAEAVILNGRKKPALRYVADFVYLRDGKEIVEDAKSPHLRVDPRYRIKRHLMKSVHGIEVFET